MLLLDGYAYQVNRMNMNKFSILKHLIWS